MVDKASRLTQSTKIFDIFSDFTDDLDPHPINGDVLKVKNDNSIKQALRNLIFTNYGERLFQPDIGCNIRKTLFEFNDTTTTDDIQYFIRKTIEQNEPRVQMTSVEVLRQTESSVLINITFLIKNTLGIQTLDLILKKIR